MPIRAISDVGASNDDILQSIRFAAGLSNAGGTVPPQKADIINLSLTLSRFWHLASPSDLIADHSIYLCLLRAVLANARDNSHHREPSCPLSGYSQPPRGETALPPPWKIFLL
jgi:hypothetical protein